MKRSISSSTMAAALYLAVGAPAFGAAPDQGSPQAFSGWLYSAFHDGRQRETSDDAQHAAVHTTEEIFSPELAQLSHAEEAWMAKGGSSDFDENEFCWCQESPHPSWKITTVSKTPTTAVSSVQFRNEGQVTLIKLDLVRTPAGWRVDNIHNPGGSYKAALRTEISKPAQ